MEKILLLLTFLSNCAMAMAQFNTVSRDTLAGTMVGHFEDDAVSSSTFNDASGYYSGTAVRIQSGEQGEDNRLSGVEGNPVADVPSTLRDSLNVSGMEKDGAEGAKRGIGRKITSVLRKWRKGKKKREEELLRPVSMYNQEGVLDYRFLQALVEKDTVRNSMCSVREWVSGDIDRYEEDDVIIGKDFYADGINAFDLIRLNLLGQRSTVSLPLDDIYVTSPFGIRTDPFGRGQRFHDGVDLRCRYAPVYSMLPGVITKVAFGHPGWGNHIVISHGNIECLYAHLCTIGVEVGQEVSAGDIVAVSGNTGRSTSPHLHIKMTFKGQRVDPLVFIDFLGGYIRELRGLLSDDTGSYTAGNLNIPNLIKVMEHYGIHHQNVVLAQAWLETGGFTSSVCRNKNNLFGLRRHDGQYFEFDTWEDSVRGYRDKVQYKYRGGDYYVFLRDLPYAEDPNYIYKVRQVEGQMGEYGFGQGEGG